MRISDLSSDVCSSDLVRLDEFEKRPLEHRGAEAVERVADALKQPEVLAELGDRVERAHARLGDELVPALEQARHVLPVELAGQLVRGARVFGAGGRHPIPGRVVGSEAELPQPGGRCQGSDEDTSELPSLMRIPYHVYC